MSGVDCAVAPSELRHLDQHEHVLDGRTTGSTTTRVTVGRVDALRGLDDAAPLLTHLGAPVTARGPWLTVALHAGPTPILGPRPRVVGLYVLGQGRPVGAALLTARRGVRRGVPVTTVALLGDGDPSPPPGGAPRRLAALDVATADALAAGLVEVLRGVRGRWVLRLTGLPLGDPTLAALARRLGTGARFSTSRSRALVDRLDDLDGVHRSQDPADLDRWLPDLLARRPAGSSATALRSAARVHAATGELEHAVVVREGRVVAGLVTLLDGEVRRPWWGASEVGGLETGPGQPAVSLTASSTTVNELSAPR